MEEKEKEKAPTPKDEPPVGHQLSKVMLDLLARPGAEDVFARFLEKRLKRPEVEGEPMDVMNSSSDSAPGTGEPDLKKLKANLPVNVE